MAPKRKSDATEQVASRRSTRTASTQAAGTKKDTAKNDSKDSIDTSKVVADSEPAAEDGEDAAALKETEDKKTDEPVTKKNKSGKVNIGDSLPNITLKDDSDKSVSLLDESKDSGIVLFSYPAASTPGCTSQACSYRDQYEDITKRGFKVFGISTDTVAAQSKFKAKNAFKYPLLSDPKKELLGPLGGSTSAKKTALRCHWVIRAGSVLEAVEINVKPKDCVSKALSSIDNMK